MHQTLSNFLSKSRDEILLFIENITPKIIIFKIQSKPGAREARDSPTTPPSCNPAYKIEHNDEHDGMAYRHIYYIYYTYMRLTQDLN